MIAIVAGVNVATTLQARTAMLRLVSTKITAGACNSILATGKYELPASGTLLSFVLLIVVGVITLNKFYLKSKDSFGCVLKVCAIEKTDKISVFISHLSIPPI